MIRTTVALGVAILLAVATLSVVVPAGALPVTLVTPVSDSMEPAIEQSDLVVVTPDESPESGDVALYRSSAHDRPVLHRIVERTDDGFVTRGDANDVTDQAGGADPVPPDAVVGTTVTVGGTPVTVPYLGLLFGNRAVLMGAWLFAASFAAAALVSGGPRTDALASSTGSRLPMYAFVILTLVVVPAVVVAAPASTGVTVTTTETAPDDAPHLVQPGERTTLPVTVSTPLSAGTHHSVHLSGDLAVASVGPDPDSADLRVAVTNEPRSTVGSQRGELTVYTYPATLPAPVVDWLASRSPLLAAGATASVLGIAATLVTLVAIDPKQPLRLGRRTIRAARTRRWDRA